MGTACAENGSSKAEFGPRDGHDPSMAHPRDPVAGRQLDPASSCRALELVNDDNFGSVRPSSSTSTARHRLLLPSGLSIRGTQGTANSAGIMDLSALNSCGTGRCSNQPNGNTCSNTPLLPLYHKLDHCPVSFWSYDLARLALTGSLMKGCCG